MSSRHIPSRLHWILSIACWMLPILHVHAQDTITATFTLNQPGNPALAHAQITVDLDYTAAPRTVANFIALAEENDNRPWLDLRNGAIRSSNFYQGLTFHRIVNSTGFKIAQSGSPRADGSDGPGWSYPDEPNALAKHHDGYVIAMANSGPNSSGSQFYLTSVPIPSLDGGYNVFGRVQTPSQTVVDALMLVPVTSEKPDTTVTIENLLITRTGPTALAFDTSAQSLPTLSDPLPLLTQPTPATYSLQTPLAPSCETYRWRTPDLLAWTADGRQIIRNQADPPANLLSDVTLLVGDSPAYFFRAARVTYPIPILTPALATLASKKLTINLNPTQRIEYTFSPTISESQAGTFLLITNETPQGPFPFAVTTSNYIQDPYRVRAYLDATTVTFDYSISALVFTTSTTGTHKGTLYGSSTNSVTGTFTIQ